jgi:multiple antibiotic resistance protein
MDLLELGVNFFVTLFALTDPIGNIPIFAAATATATAAQRRTIALYIALFAAGFMALFYLSGLALLEFFGISLPAFRIAGGILLFMLGLDMTRTDFISHFNDPDAGETPAASEGVLPGDTRAAVRAQTRAYARKRFERLIVPFGMPLLIGPGAIGAVIIQAGDAAKLGPQGTAVGLVSIVVTAAAIMVAFMLTGPISRALGKIGMAIVVRVLGLILCALAVQFIISGLGETTYGVIRSAIASPYGGGH